MKSKDLIGFIPPEIQLAGYSLFMMWLLSGCGPEQANMVIRACIDQGENNGICDQGEIPVEGYEVTKSREIGQVEISEVYETDKNGEIYLHIGENGAGMNFNSTQQVIINGMPYICTPDLAQQTQKGIDFTFDLDKCTSEAFGNQS